MEVDLSSVRLPGCSGSSGALQPCLGHSRRAARGESDAAKHESIALQEFSAVLDPYIRLNPCYSTLPSGYKI